MRALMILVSLALCSSISLAQNVIVNNEVTQVEAATTSFIKGEIAAEDYLEMIVNAPGEEEKKMERVARAIKASPIPKEVLEERFDAIADLAKKGNAKIYGGSFYNFFNAVMMGVATSIGADVGGFGSALAAGVAYGGGALGLRMLLFSRHFKPTSTAEALTKTCERALRPKRDSGGSWI